MSLLAVIFSGLVFLIGVILLAAVAGLRLRLDLILQAMGEAEQQKAPPKTTGRAYTLESLREIQESYERREPRKYADWGPTPRKVTRG